MNVFSIRVADHVVGVETLHIRSMALCRDYLTDVSPEFVVRTTQQDIDQERICYEKQNGECTLWDGALEMIALHRKLSEQLIDSDVFMMHGAAVAYHDETFIFSAKSGIGKTTHIQKWLEHLPDAFVVNGDKPFIITNPSPQVCGSPWAGKENLYRNTIVPLKAIIFIERAPENHIERISFPDAFPRLLLQTHRPADTEKMRKTLALMKTLDGRVAFYRFHINNFKDDCFQVAYNALVNGIES